MASPSTMGLLLAAGSGSRLGGAVPKAFLVLGGRPMFLLGLEAMVAAAVLDGVVLVVPPGDVDRAQEVLAAGPGEVGWRDRAAGDRLPVLGVVAGGRTRQESVRMGLEALDREAATVVCHDAARPFATPDLFERVVGALQGVEGAVPVVPVADTVKRVRDGVVVATLPREEIALAQTPQAFVSSALREAHAVAIERGIEATDDAALLEAAGFRVAAVEGEAENFKVTSAADLRRAEERLADRGRAEAASGG